LFFSEGMAFLGVYFGVLSWEGTYRGSLCRGPEMVQVLSKGITSGSVQGRFVLKIGWPGSPLLAVG
jgi:hypothetical protein